MLLHETREYKTTQVEFYKKQRDKKDKINHIDKNIFATIKILICVINFGLENVKIVLRVLKEHSSDIDKNKISKSIKVNGRYIEQLDKHLIGLLE